MEEARNHNGRNNGGSNQKAHQRDISQEWATRQMIEVVIDLPLHPTCESTSCYTCSTAPIAIDGADVV